MVYGAGNGLALGYPLVSPAQLAGLEVNEYARELAQVAIWIGYLQWRIGNGFSGLPVPILEPLETIRLQDALLDRSDPAYPKEAAWPAADYIIGNPPFLGRKRLREELGNEYVQRLYSTYGDRIRGEADLVCYFFEKARAAIFEARSKRSGLLATSSIKQSQNRLVLERIKQTGDIFMAWDDEPWVLNGAAVRIAIIGFDDGTETERTLDGLPVSTINADLTTTQVDVLSAKPLPENADLAFQGDTKGGPFEIPGDLARSWLALPINPNGRPNSDVIRPWFNGHDITDRPKGAWIIDFGIGMSEHVAAMYEAPYEYALQTIKSARERSKSTTGVWWIHERPRKQMRASLSNLPRFIATVRVSKHCFFVWLPGGTIPDNRLAAIARSDDYAFGVLHSRAHEIWSLRLGARHGVGNDPTYTPTTCFETFPLPWVPGQEPWRDPRLHAIADAARELDEKRRAWLDPPGASEADLKKRTLTNLYNARPAWLQQAHAVLDRAVWAAYGWADPDPAIVEEDVLLARLLALNLERTELNTGPAPRTVK